MFCPTSSCAPPSANAAKNFGRRNTAQRSPKTKETTTPPTPTSEPTNEYLRNILRFVSSPERKRSITEASVAIPYSAGEVASNTTPVSFAISRSAAPWNSPLAK